MSSDAGCSTLGDVLPSAAESDVPRAGGIGEPLATGLAAAEPSDAGQMMVTVSP